MKRLIFAIAVLGTLTNAGQGYKEHVKLVSKDESPKQLGEAIFKLFEAAADCDGCQGILTALKGAAEAGNDFFDETLTEVCILSGVEDKDVCQGIIAREGPLIAHDLRELSIGSHTADLLCTNLLGLCPYPAVRPYKVELPKPVHKRSRPPPSGKTPIQIGHISDTHVDLDYTVGASYNCTKPICCRPYTAADAPGNTSYPAGPYGNHACDAPLSLEKNMLAAMNALVPNMALTIFTGDVPAHDVWLINRREATKDLDVSYTQFEKLPLVYPAVGNHDTAPVNAFPPKGLDIYSQVNPQWTYDIFASYWKKWIGGKAAKSAKKDGSYSVLYPGTKLRVISLNSIYYYTLNFWMYQDPMVYDPNDQFKWLVQELQSAETADERVWIIAHVPSGNADFFRDYSSYFNQIIQRYSGTISACFYGHTHVDQFQLAYQNYSAPSFDTAVMMSYITPSMTPTSGSPAFRIYDVDPETFAVLDFTEYIANYTSPQYQVDPVWTKYYSAKETYGSLLHPPLTDASAELTPAFWHNVTEVFERNSNQFNAYISRKTRGYSNATCQGSCKKQEICGIRAANAEYNCAQVTPGISFSKRHLYPEEPHVVDDCGESRIKSVFQAARQAGRQELR